VAHRLPIGKALPSSQSRGRRCGAFQLADRADNERSPSPSRARQQIRQRLKTHALRLGKFAPVDRRERPPLHAAPALRHREMKSRRYRPRGQHPVTRNKGRCRPDECETIRADRTPLEGVRPSLPPTKAVFAIRTAPERKSVRASSNPSHGKTRRQAQYVRRPRPERARERRQVPLIRIHPLQSAAQTVTAFGSFSCFAQRTLTESHGKSLAFVLVEIIKAQLFRWLLNSRLSSPRHSSRVAL